MDILRSGPPMTGGSDKISACGIARKRDPAKGWWWWLPDQKKSHGVRSKITFTLKKKCDATQNSAHFFVIGNASFELDLLVYSKSCECRNQCMSHSHRHKSLRLLNTMSAAAEVGVPFQCNRYLFWGEGGKESDGWWWW